MKLIAKSLAAGTVAIMIATTTLAAPAEAKVRGKDVAAGILFGIAAIAIASQAADAGPPPPPRYGRGPGYRGPKGRRGGCGWLRQKAQRTGSPYWWDRYDACRGRW